MSKKRKILSILVISILLGGFWMSAEAQNYAKSKSVTIDGLKYLVNGTSAELKFVENTSLETIVVPATITSGSTYTVDRISADFGSCDKLVSITIPKEVEEIYANFSGCVSLKEIIVADDNEYYYSEGGILYEYPLETDEVSVASTDEVWVLCVPQKVEWDGLTWDKDVIGIRDGAFKNVKTITTLSGLDGVVEIEDNAFAGSLISKIELNKELKTIGDNVFGVNVTSITVSDKNTTFTSIDGALYSIDGTVLYAYPSALTTAVIPASVTNMQNPFHKKSVVEEITFKGSVPVGNLATVKLEKLSTIYVPCSATIPTSNASVNLYNVKKNTYSVIDDNMVLDPADCDCLTGDTITIKNGATLAFSSYTDAVKTALASKIFVLEKSLPAGKYSTLGNLSKETTYEYLKNNKGDKTGLAHGFAKKHLDYETNDWTSFLSYATETPENGASLVYPYYTAVGGGDVLADDNVIVSQIIENVHADDFSFTLTNTGSTDGGNGVWFGLANPYMGMLDLKSFFTNNSGFNKVITIFNNGDWDQVTLSKGSNIGLMPAGAMFVTSKSNASSVTVNYKTSQIKTSEAEVIYKSTSNDNVIEFVAKANGLDRNAVAMLDENSSNGYDGEDGHVMFSVNEDKVSPYFVVDGNNLFANSFASLPYTSEINFHAQKTADVEFLVNNVPAGMEVSIVDVLSGEETILTDGDAFNFTADEGENSGRYQIKFAKKSAGIENVADANVSVYNNNNEIFVNANGLKNIEVINTLGQVVYSSAVSGDNAKVTLNANAGAYIVNVRTINGTQSAKIVVK